MGWTRQIYLILIGIFRSLYEDNKKIFNSIVEHLSIKYSAAGVTDNGHRGLVSVLITSVYRYYFVIIKVKW